MVSCGFLAEFTTLKDLYERFRTKNSENFSKQTQFFTIFHPKTTIPPKNKPNSNPIQTQYKTCPRWVLTCFSVGEPIQSHFIWGAKMMQNLYSHRIIKKNLLSVGIRTNPNKANSIQTINDRAIYKDFWRKPAVDSIIRAWNFLSCFLAFWARRSSILALQNLQPSVLR